MSKKNDKIANVDVANFDAASFAATKDEGFAKVNQSVDAFYAVEGPTGKPVPFRGIPIAVREREDDEGEIKQYVTLKVTSPFPVRTGEKDETIRTADNPKGYVFRMAAIDEIVWVDIRAEYRNIVDFMPKATPAGVFAYTGGQAEEDSRKVGWPPFAYRAPEGS